MFEKITALWHALRPDVQKGLIYAGVVLALIFSVYLCACTPPVRSVDSTQTREDLKKTADKLAHASESVPLYYKPVVIEAQKALDQCSRLLGERDRQVNQCAEANKNAAERMGEMNAEITRLQGGTIFSRVTHWWKGILDWWSAVFGGMIAGCLLTLLGPALFRVLWGLVRPRIGL